MFFQSDACDSDCDLRGIIEVRQLIQPRSVCVEVPHHVASQIASALPFVVPRACIMDITKGPLYGIGSWAIRRYPPQRNAGMGCSPRPDRFGFMALVVIDHNRDTPHPALRVGALQEGQQVTKYSIGFPRTEAMEELPSGEVEGASQGVFFVLPRAS